MLATAFFRLHIRGVFHVYILRSESDSKEIHVAYARNPEARLKDHNAGMFQQTARWIPWSIAWDGAFPDKEKALKFEAYLKTAPGKAFANKRLL